MEKEASPGLDVSSSLNHSGLPRWVDFLSSFLGLLLISPLLLAVAAAVACSSRGPILFRQQRVGRGGKPFTFYKFRSMYHNPEGLPLTASGDSRVTPLGKVLRKLKLDELPGLVNVLKGDVSLVGPRPEVPRFVDLNDPLWQEVLKAKPGVTDPVTLRLRNEEELLGALEGDPELFYTLYLLPFKLRGYCSYLSQRTWRSDLWVLWNTFLGIIFPGRNPPPTSDELANLWSEDTQTLETSSTKRSFLASYQRQLQFLLDLAVLASAFLLAYLLRYEFSIPDTERSRVLVQLPAVLLIQLSAYFLAGIHNFVWRYISLSEVQAFVRAGLTSAVPLVALRLGLASRFQSWRVPLSIIVLDAILAFGGLLALRVARRMSYEKQLRQRLARTHASEEAKKVLLVGAGQAGVLATRELENRADLRLEIKGFIDDDPLKQGTLIRGVRVLGTTEDLPRLVSSLKIHHVIITIADATPLELSRILETCHKVPIPARIIPGLFEILDGSVEVSRQPRASSTSP
ncbi:MAG: sugar transferase [Deltaproteobacteria bacterium]|nr:sugar transferase [Deltaproteobacteria bacterium]